MTNLSLPGVKLVAKLGDEGGTKPKESLQNIRSDDFPKSKQQRGVRRLQVRHHSKMSRSVETNIRSCQNESFSDTQETLNIQTRSLLQK